MIGIRIYRDMEDPQLKSAWHDLFARNEYCCQSSYTWCSLWLKYFQKNKRMPCVVTAEEEGRIIGIGPFMIEKRRLISELKFIGSGLTDFHEILALPGRNDEIQKAIIDWILGREYYDLINLEQISDKSPLNNVLKRFGTFKMREMIKCPVVNFGSMDWETYLHKLPGSLRQKWSRRVRLLKREGRLRFLRVEDIPGKISFLDKIFDLHMKRGEHEGRVSKFSLDTLRAFLSALVADEPEVAMYILLFNDQLIAYKLGFDHKGIFYAWNSAFLPAFARYAPGIVLRGLVIQDLMMRGARQYFDMRGNYDWKRRWMTDDETLTNFQFLARRSPVIGYFGERYYLTWKWRLKRILGSLLRLPLIQKILIRSRYGSEAPN